MKLPSKETVKYAVQSMLIIGTSITGFMDSYLSIWKALGLPKTIWAVVVIMAMGIISEIGLFIWIAEN